MARKQHSLRTYLVRAVANSVVMVGLLGASFVVTDHLAGPGIVFPEDVATPAARVEVPTRRADECWTSKQEPKASLPGAAVVVVDGETVYTKKHGVVDAAFNEALASIGLAEHRATLPFEHVVALCV